MFRRLTRTPGQNQSIFIWPFAAFESGVELEFVKKIAHLSSPTHLCVEIDAPLLQWKTEASKHVLHICVNKNVQNRPEGENSPNLVTLLAYVGRPLL
jgi:hypothetical protein